MEPYLQNEDLEWKRSVLVRFVDRIYVYEDHRIEIIFRYRDEIEKTVGLAEDERNSPASEEAIGNGEKNQKSSQAAGWAREANTG